MFEDFINKNVKLIYEDGLNHFSKKYGLVVEINGTHIILKTNNHSEAINLTKVLRIEENGN